MPLFAALCQSHLVHAASRARTRSRRPDHAGPDNQALQKGVVFRDNVLYPPMKAEALTREISILRTLGGRSFNLKLDSTYESPSKIYAVTELCEG